MLSFSPAARKTLLIAIDFVIVALAALFAFWVMAVRAQWAFDSAYLLNHFGWFIFLPALWFSSAFLTSLYTPQKIADLGATVWSLLHTIMLTVIVYLLIYFYSGTPGDIPRGIVIYQGAASFLLVILRRVVYGSLICRPAFAHKVIIVGAGWAGQTIARTIQQFAQVYCHIVGFVDDDPTKQGTTLTIVAGDDQPLPVNVPILGTTRDLTRLVKEQKVSEIILAISHGIHASLFQALLECREQGKQITLMPVFFEQLTGMVPIEHVGDHWNSVLPLASTEASGLYPIVKRVFDIVGALIGLMLYMPMLPLIILAIKLDSPGPVVFRQARVGKGGGSSISSNCGR